MKWLVCIACICGFLIGAISFVAAQSAQIPRSYLPLIIRGDSANPEPPDGTTTPTPTMDSSVTPSATPPPNDRTATPTSPPGNATATSTPPNDRTATPTSPGNATATPTPPPGNATATPTPFPEISPIGGVINGDFEQGPFEWGDPDHNKAIIRDEFAHNVEPPSGEWMAVFDSKSMSPKELTREIQVPRNATHFGFQTWIVSSKAECQEDPDRLVVFLSRERTPVNNKTIAVCQRTSENLWKLHWLQLPENVQGETISIRIFANSEDGFKSSTVYVDDVTFGAENADP
ncbi:MAG: hypothetical protein GFH27_549379n56 [Chloroflexi bacterium AL-W]|nr:hypothetical protein [Chloroflexi bacterium AL-N1]NOK71180.1 hypothetical protein [Chloroflexi bacterium AL-N10]NOK78646.1 hypothetical protein [Chloroflexi bacterium AL-N5]NOK85942.1 hypothetical protein [Chloroflexi bacterium AL-W]NOK92917.1 hypothetical protein [Chloroflexi bacterium AL-N15]